MKSHGATGLTENITGATSRAFKQSLEMHEATLRAFKYCFEMHGTSWSNRVNKKYYKSHMDTL